MRCLLRCSVLFWLAIGSALSMLHHSILPVAQAEDWPQWRGPQRDGRWNVQGLVEQLPDGQLPLEWSVPLGPGYAGPTVADGRVYVTDRQSADDGSGQTERILCLQSATGEKIWEHIYPAPYTIRYTAGPRASVTIDRGVAYAVGAMGHFHALDAVTGKLLWQHDLNE
jgi:outer membrane protein assembly factor BamB